VFKGTYRYRIDAKGRLPVPPPFRSALQDEGNGAVVTLVDQCLGVYPPRHWTRLEQQLLALPPFSAKAKTLSRLLLSRAADVELDVQSRILVPPALRAAAGLRDEVVVVGVLDRFELWSPDTWDSFLRDSEKLLDDVSLDLAWPSAPAPAQAANQAPDKPRSEATAKRPRR
jgi:MraZ protein